MVMFKTLRFDCFCVQQVFFWYLLNVYQCRVVFRLDQEQKSRIHRLKNYTLKYYLQFLQLFKKLYNPTANHESCFHYYVMYSKY